MNTAANTVVFKGPFAKKKASTTAMMSIIIHVAKTTASGIAYLMNTTQKTAKKRAVTDKLLQKSL